MPNPTKPLTSSQNDSFLLEFIQKYASIGTWQYDIEQRSLHWSPETKRIHEVPIDFEPNVKIGVSFYKKGHSRNTIIRLFKNCLEKHKDYDAELEIITAKGEEKWVRAIGMPIVENNTCIKIIGLFQDINEKTKRSKALAFKENQLRKTFDYALVGMALLDLKGNWINVNQSLCSIFGYSRKELMKLTFTSMMHPEEEADHDAIANMISGKIDHFESEKRYLNKEGKTIWALLSTSIVKDNQGKPKHFVVQVNDLSQIKRSSKKVEQLLITTKNQNRRLLNFAHIVSHNLRSHYSNLSMLLNLAKIDIPETVEISVFQLMETALNNLGETVENLNEVTAINTTDTIEIETLNVLNSINNVLTNINDLITDSKASITMNIDSDIYVKAIPAYFDNIMLNFLTNAIKYKKSTEPAKIELSASTTDDWAIIKIKDHGIGIDLSKHGDKLFGMYKTFHQYENSRGLGLFIAKNQVEAIGGKIDVESEVNIGTTFYLYLNKDEKN